MVELGWAEPGVSAVDGLTATAALLILAAAVAPFAARTLRWDPRA